MSTELSVETAAESRGGVGDVGSARPRTVGGTFSFSQARSLIGDLTKPNPKIYWTDFLLSITAGYVALHATLHVPRLFWPEPWVIPVTAVAYFATVILFMRSVMFIHE